MSVFSIENGHVFFFGGIFSNFYTSEFMLDGIKFRTSEHAFMYAKARHFNDATIAAKILVARYPSDAKALGRQVANFDPVSWGLVSEEHMERACLAKFSQNTQLKQWMLDTGDAVLVEASPYDRIWGIGLSVLDADRLDPALWLGQNLLGKVLMKVRDQLL